MSTKRERAARRGKRAGVRRRGTPRNAFESEVRECARELALMRPMLLADFSAAALAAALAISAVRALAQCVREGTMSLDEARGLIECMIGLEAAAIGQPYRESRADPHP